MLDKVKKALRSVTELHESGAEIPDPEPMAIDTGLRRPESIQDQIRRMIRNEASMAAAESGRETWEEADDFDIGDDFEPHSPYEQDFDQQTSDLPGEEELRSQFQEERPIDKRSQSGDDDPPADDHQES